MKNATPPKKKLPCKTEGIISTRSCVKPATVTFRPIGQYQFRLAKSIHRLQLLSSCETGSIILYNW